MQTRIAIVALLLLGCAGSPEDAFVGRWDGSYECSGAYVGLGVPYMEGPAPQTIRIERATDGRTYIAGSCTIWLDVISATRAGIDPATCEAITPDGNPATVMFTSGAISLDEPRLAYVMQATMETGTQFVQMACTFDGTRIE